MKRALLWLSALALVSSIALIVLRPRAPDSTSSLPSLDTIPIPAPPEIQIRVADSDLLTALAYQVRFQHLYAAPEALRAKLEAACRNEGRLACEVRDFIARGPTRSALRRKLEALCEESDEAVHCVAAAVAHTSSAAAELGRPYPPPLGAALEKHCEAGDRRACAFAARAKPAAEGRAQALSACEQGEPLACGYLAQLDCDSLDENLCLLAHDRACGQGLLASCVQAEELRLTMDPGRAVEALAQMKTHCRRGDHLACYMAGYVLEGVGAVAPDPRASLEYVRIACRADVIEGCYALGRHLAHLVDTPVVAQELDRGVALLDRAHDDGMDAACGQACIALLSAEEHARAGAKAGPCCKEGDEYACTVLAYLLRTGKGAALDVERAKEILRSLEASTDAEVLHDVGWSYETGQAALDPGLVRARSSYTRACKLDHQRSCDALERLTTEAGRARPSD